MLIKSLTSFSMMGLNIRSSKGTKIYIFKYTNGIWILKMYENVLWTKLQNTIFYITWMYRSNNYACPIISGLTQVIWHQLLLLWKKKITKVFIRHWCMVLSVIPLYYNALYCNVWYCNVLYCNVLCTLYCTVHVWLHSTLSCLPFLMQISMANAVPLP